MKQLMLWLQWRVWKLNSEAQLECTPGATLELLARDVPPGPRNKSPGTLTLYLA